MFWVKIEKHLLNSDVAILARGECLYSNYSIVIVMF